MKTADYVENSSKQSNRTAKYTSHAVKNVRKLVLSNQLPPKPGIVLAFENAPDVFGAVFGFIDEVSTSFQVVFYVLHSGC